MIGAILAAVSAVESVAKGTKGIMAGLSGTDRKDPARIAAAQSALDKALAGDTSQILYMQQQAGQVVGHGSATPVGKEAFRRALAAYDSAKGTHFNLGDAVATQTSLTPAQAVVQQTTQNVRQDLANGAQQLLTGATNKVTSSISPNAGTSIPLTQNQKYGLIAAGILAVFLIPRLLRHHG